jgi:hypothetical protein
VVNIPLQFRSRDTLKAHVAKTVVKFGLVSLGLGILSFVALLTAMGGMGPCANSGQVAAVLFGMAATGIGGLLILGSLPVILVRKYKARHLPNSPCTL